MISGFTESVWQHGVMQEKGPEYVIKPAQVDQAVSSGSKKTECISYGSNKCKVGARKWGESTGRRQAVNSQVQARCQKQIRTRECMEGRGTRRPQRSSL